MRITFLILKDYRHAHNQSSGPIGLAYLSSAAKARFPDTHVQIEVDVDQVIASKPDLIGISAFTETYSQSIDAARYLKRRLPETPIWLGGPHINALPGTLGKDFQLGVVGEGEDAFVELLALMRKGQLSPDQLQHVNGIVYWDEGQRKITPPRKTPQDLDLIIPPDRSVMKTYWPPLQREIQWPQPIYTSRGCPFKCVFCIFSMNEEKVRYHSVERVVLEIEDILRHHPEQTHISIHDDLFALSKKRLHALTQGIREAGLHKRVSFVCMAKASIFTDDMAKLMRDMNISIVTFGIESGVQRILEYLKGPRNKVEDNVRAIDICAQHGLRMGGYFIIGTPHETYQELQQAYWFIRHNFPPLKMAGVFRLTPFPGAKFWEEARQRGIVSNDQEDWRPFNYLDQDKRDFLFFNDHYSLEDFNAAYPHFVRITDRNGLGLEVENFEALFTKHLEPIYLELFQQLKPQRVLELTGFTRLTAELLARDENLPFAADTLHVWNWKRWQAPELPAAHYDLIICTLGLEQIPQAPAKTLAHLQQALAPGGRLLLVTYQPRHERLLKQLLSDRWHSDYWHTPPLDVFSYVAPEQLARLLQADFQIEQQTVLRSLGHQISLPEAVQQLLLQLNPRALDALDQIAQLTLTAPYRTQAGALQTQTPDTLSV